MLKYLLGPVLIDTKKKLYVRKRILHKGYAILSSDNVSDDKVYTHIVYVNDLKHAEKFLYNEYGLNITL